MHIFLLIIIIIFLYGAFSTLFHSTEMVGKIGKMYGEGNINLFGYLAYVDLLILIYPLYQMYHNKKLSKEIEFYAGWILLFISLILFQALIVDSYHTGSIGLSLYDFLNPFIGKAGMWLFWLLITGISLVLILDEIPDVKRYIPIFNQYKKWLMEKLMIAWDKMSSRFDNPFFDKQSTESMTSIVAARRVRRNLNTQSVKQEAPKKLVHKKKTVKQKRPQSTEELGMLEDRSIEDIGNIKLQEISKLVKEDNISEPVVEKKAPLQESIKTTRKTTKKAKSETVTKKEVTKTENKKENKEKNDPIKSEETIRKERDSSAKILDELKENKALMDQLEKGKIEAPEDFILPYLDFLEEAPETMTKVNEEEIDRKVHELLDKLGQFKITGEVMDIYSGPLVTTFEFKPAANVKVSKILNLQDDLAMALCAETIRIQAPIPGRDVVGIEIPNESFNTIYLRDILESELFLTSKSPLTMAMGKDIVGNPFVTDLKKLPHLLIAGTTGSGKSVGINAMILSLLYRNDPDALKLMLIDPKMLEFSIYNDIPHLITPVITDAAKAIAALANMVGEMERRYKMMAESRTKNIDNYNQKAKKKGLDPMPFIVIVIDELADLMMNGGKDVEYSIARLAQMARASGIHLIVATQRPSVDVVTGLIKANLPSRLSYRVGQRIDSKVILDALGADTLLGKGDALFTPPGSNGLVRIHAPWNSEEEIEEIVEFLKEQRTPEYDERYLVQDGNDSKAGIGVQDDLDELYEDAKKIILADQKTSISYLQRKLQIGYNRSANIIEQLQEMGILSAPNNKGQREIII